MADRAKVLQDLQELSLYLFGEYKISTKEHEEEAYNRFLAANNALGLIKGQKAVPNELKNKMWNALFAKEDKCEKSFTGTEDHEKWYLYWRPWLLSGFGIAIDAIAEWEEGR